MVRSFSIMPPNNQSRSADLRFQPLESKEPCEISVSAHLDYDLVPLLLVAGCSLFAASTAASKVAVTHSTFNPAFHQTFGGTIIAERGVSKYGNGVCDS
jgi:hypothetical protein